MVAVGATELIESLGPQAIDDILVGHYVPLLEFNHGPMTVGLDGGYLRAAHKQGCFEVIAGRSVVAFRRAEGDPVPPAKCFGFVQTYDEKPRQRLWALMQSQGMQENQQLVFMSDGGEDVRQVQEYLHPNSEHLMDWFHITMRLTVLQQQTKALTAETEAPGKAASKQIESVKHLLWHGNVEEALDRIDSLFLDLDLICRRCEPAAKLARGIAEFRTFGQHLHRLFVHADHRLFRIQWPFVGG